VVCDVPLPTAFGPVVVRWHDTPGIRQNAGPLEREAIELARKVIGSAEVLVALVEAGPNPAPPEGLERRPDLWVANKIDKTPEAVLPEGAIGISARTGEGVEALCQAVAGLLGLAEGPSGMPWAFSTAARGMLEGPDTDALRRWAGL